MRQGALWVSLLFWIGGVALQAAPQVTPDQFGNWFRAGLSRDDLRVPVEIRSKASQYHYVFITGFLNEGIPEYYGQAIKELRLLGVPARQIHRFSPSSGRSVEDNAQVLKEEVIDSVLGQDEKAVIVAHSRGTVDALAFALNNADFVRDSVEAIFLVQGSLQGSWLADLVEGTGHPIDSRMPLAYRLLGRLLETGERLIHKRIEGGMVGLTHANIKRFWDRLLEERREAIPLITDKVFYITGWEDPSRMAPVLRSEGWYLKTYYGPSDGEVEISDQTMPGIGKTLALLEVDHAGLVCPRPISNTSAKLRRAFGRAIFMTVGQPEAIP